MTPEAVEFFGQMRLTFDLESKPSQDMMSVAGYLQAIQRTLRVCTKGLLWLGTPCRSFVWVSRSRHKRSRANPFGDSKHRFVECGNSLTARSVILCLIALVRGVLFFTEQPSGSCMDIFPYVEWLLSLNIKLGTYLDVYAVRWIFS